MKKIKFLSVFLMMLLANFALISCGSDDDGDSGGADTGAPYTGVWKAVHMEIIEDGEEFSGNVPGNCIMELTLNADGTYKYYYYFPGEDGDEDEETIENGTWSFDAETSKINCEMTSAGDYFVSTFWGETDVLTWTASKMVLRFAEDDGYVQTTTFVRK